MVRILIEEVLDNVQGWVRFWSGAESVKGCWAGPGEVPAGREFDIEMEYQRNGSSRLVPRWGPSRIRWCRMVARWSSLDAPKNCHVDGGRLEGQDLPCPWP